MLFGDDGGFAEQGGLLVGHFEEQQVGELFDVVAIADAIVAEDVAVVPEFLDDGGGFVGHADRLAGGTGDSIRCVDLSGQKFGDVLDEAVLA